MRAPITIAREMIAAFCRRNHIRRLSLFEVGGLMCELSEAFGRQVDIRTPADLSPYFRDQVVGESELLYAA